MGEFDLLELKSGVRAVHKYTPGAKVTHCGFVLNIGSRDELQHENGVAHFWEHMAFKGTPTRKAFHILNRLESVGGELNAYTTKEKIYFYASVLTEHFERALELLVDITFQSIFPVKEIEKERGVIVEEISMYEDSPEELIFDEFENLIYRNHALGRFILGTRESVNSINQQSFYDFIARNLSADRVVFSSVGDIKPDLVNKLVTKYIGEIQFPSSNYLRNGTWAKEPIKQQSTKYIQQMHGMMGIETYSLHDEKRLPFVLMSNLLGGPAMTSWLNMSLRERKGLVYNIETNYTPFTDTGVFSIYFSTDIKNSNKVYRTIFKDLDKIKNTPLGRQQLQSLKKQALGQLAIAEESNASVMQMMGRSILDFGRIESFEEVVQKVEDISASMITDVAIDILREDKFTVLEYIPHK